MAIFRFDNFCERYAEIYVPVSHVKDGDVKDKRFFRHDLIEERVAFVKALSSIQPAHLLMSVITAYDGAFERTNDKAWAPGFVMWTRQVLFWAKEEPGGFARQPMDTETAAAEAKTLAAEAALDFCSFICKCTDRHAPAQQRIAELEGVQLDTIEIGTADRSFNGWWPCVVKFDHLEPRPKCVAGAKYDEAKVRELFPMLNWQKAGG